MCLDKVTFKFGKSNMRLWVVKSVANFWVKKEVDLLS